MPIGKFNVEGVLVMNLDISNCEAQEDFNNALSNIKTSDVLGITSGFGVKNEY